MENGVLQESLVDLQSRLAFQEEAINALNLTVARQQRQIDDLVLQLEQLQRHVRALTPPEFLSSGEEPPPPHY